MAQEKDVQVYQPGAKNLSKDALDQTEESAQAYLRHKENGNVDKARQLGQRLAEMVVEDLPAIEDNSEDWLLIDHLKVLYIFVAEQIIRECPDELLFQVSLAAFREAIERDVPGAYDAMSGSGADTFYQLAYYRKQEGSVAHQMGQAMAQLYGRAGDWKIVTIGEHLFSEFQQRCREACQKTQYL